jgi:hypothetical protein
LKKRLRGLSRGKKSGVHEKARGAARASGFDRWRGAMVFDRRSLSF